VDVVRGGGETRAVAADDRIEGFVEAALVDHQPAADYHAGDHGAVLCMNKLVLRQRVEQRFCPFEIRDHRTGFSKPVELVAVKLAPRNIR
jgi:hypothetical protein